MAGDVTDIWPSLGRHLGIPERVIKTIQGNVNYDSPKEKAFQLLWIWYTSDHPSTFGELVKALVALGKDVLVLKHRLRDQYVMSKMANKSHRTSLLKKVRLQVK